MGPLQRPPEFWSTLHEGTSSRDEGLVLGTLKEPGTRNLLASVGYALSHGKLDRFRLRYLSVSLRTDT